MVHLPLSQSECEHLATCKWPGSLQILVWWIAGLAESILSQPKGPNFDTNPLRASFFGLTLVYRARLQL